jgi:hypothetical protein
MTNPAVGIELDEDGTVVFEDGYTGRQITFMVAPNIPDQELPQLEERYRAVLTEPTRSLVVNHEMSVFTVFIEPNARLIVVAPNIPPTTRVYLEERVNDPSVDIIAVNYELAAFSIAIGD